jgi:transaldolase
MSTDSSLHQLGTLGQSVWLDSISREWLDSGELERMIEELGITGVTSNPTIFEQALRHASYDAAIAELAHAGLADRDIFERLEVEDIRATCDLLSATWLHTKGADGMVSIELEPDLAHDTQASIERARHLWAAVDRPNLMVKVPATHEGIPVIEHLLDEGINVNVTLLFSVSVYRDVMEAYLRALEQRQARGEDLRVASVASFFVSRVDTTVDALLDEAGTGEDLRGRVAVANAIAAWEAYLETFTSQRFMTLQRAGARPQRPLWASTGTKNPSYSDILYVQELIAPGTVNTMPLTTMRAFADHGEARTTITDAACREARTVLGELRGTGVDLSAVTERLRTDGVAAFQASFDQLLASVASRRVAAG